MEVYIWKLDLKPSFRSREGKRKPRKDLQVLERLLDVQPARALEDWLARLDAAQQLEIQASAEEGTALLTRLTRLCRARGGCVADSFRGRAALAGALRCVRRLAARLALSSGDITPAWASSSCWVVQDEVGTVATLKWLVRLVEDREVGVRCSALEIVYSRQRLSTRR